MALKSILISDKPNQVYVTYNQGSRMQSLSNPAFISPQILLPIIFIPLILASFFARFIYKSIKSGILRRQKKILVKIVHDVTQVYSELDEHPLLLREYWVKGENGKE
jgi:hypothetical protein